jgi:hypothetical protein
MEQMMSEKKNFVLRVECDGQKFRTVQAAFAEHELPMNKVGRFRLELYAKGEATFNHGDKEYVFKHLKQDADPLPML